MLTRKILVSTKIKAFRRGLWYKILDEAERGILLLSSQILDTIHNSTLNHQLVKIIEKINEACKSNFSKYLQLHGLKRLNEIKKQENKFGYPKTRIFGQDIEFMKYLIFLDYNQPQGWRF